jgi:hypothetical protein
VFLIDPEWVALVFVVLVLLAGDTDAASLYVLEARIVAVVYDFGGLDALNIPVGVVKLVFIKVEFGEAVETLQHFTF